MKRILNPLFLILITNSVFSKNLPDAQYLRYFKDLFLRHDWSSASSRESDTTKKVNPVNIYLHGDWSIGNRIVIQKASYEFERLTDLNHTLVEYPEQSNLCITNDFSYAESVLSDYSGWWVSGTRFHQSDLYCYRVLLDIVKCDRKINKTLVYINPILLRKNYLIRRLSNIALARNLGYSGSSREFSNRFPRSIFSGIIDVDDESDLSDLDKSFLKLLYHENITPSRTKSYIMNRNLVFKAIRHYKLLDEVR